MPLRRRASCLFLTLMVAGAPLAPAQTERAAEEIEFRAHVTSAAGRPVEFAQVVVNGRSAQTDVTGRATLRVSTGRASIEVLASHYATIRLSVDVESNRDLDIQLQPAESVTVRAEADVLSPDPSANAYSRDEVLEANPGRPGLPLSIPGFPAETSSGGIKAPQYFAPGVAGDHGEPIAQFLQVGGFCFRTT